MGPQCHCLPGELSQCRTQQNENTHVNAKSEQACMLDIRAFPFLHTLNIQTELILLKRCPILAAAPCGACSSQASPCNKDGHQSATSSRADHVLSPCSLTPSHVPQGQLANKQSTGAVFASQTLLPPQEKPARLRRLPLNWEFCPQGTSARSQMRL